MFRCLALTYRDVLISDVATGRGSFLADLLLHGALPLLLASIIKHIGKNLQGLVHRFNSHIRFR